MKAFALDILLWPASAIFVFTLFVTLWATRSPLGAMTAAFLKAGIFLVYFAGCLTGLLLSWMIGAIWRVAPDYWPLMWGDQSGG